MLAFERLAVAYFAALAVASPSTGAPRGRIGTAVLLSTTAAAAILTISRVAPEAWRVALPLVYLPVGYWLPAVLLTGTPGGFERWLSRWDMRLLPWGVPVPASVIPALELAYLFCYPLVPIGLAIVLLRGSPVDVERFWLAVLGAGFLCYGSLPWLVGRPPRVVDETGGSSSFIRRLNETVLHRVSHRLVTFPSGHVAVSVATAIAVLAVWWPGGIIMLLMAVGIALASVAGRYHYALDVLLGAVLGIACSTMALLL